MTIKDWIGSPQEWGDWGTKATAWFNELKLGLTTHLSNAGWDVGALSFRRGTTNSGTRISDEYTVGSGARQVYINGVRTLFDNGTDAIEYGDDGSTEITTLHRDEDMFRIYNIDAATPTLDTNWSNFSVSHAYCLVYMDASGVVHLQGRVSQTGVASLASGGTIATIPVGYRPTRTHTFISYTDTGAGGPVQFNVQSDGAVRFFNAAGASGAMALGKWMGLSSSWYVGH